MHRLGLPEKVKLLGMDRLLPVPKGMRWEEINCLASYTLEARDAVLEQQWSSIDLFGEVLEGADPIPRLHQLGTSPAEVDQCFEEVEEEERDDEEYEDYEEDLPDDTEQVPGGEGAVDDSGALQPADPGAGHFSQGGGAPAWSPGVGLDPTDLEGPRPPSPAGVNHPEDNSGSPAVSHSVGFPSIPATPPTPRREPR